MASPHHIPLVEVTRGKIVESVHYGSAVVANANGHIVASVGDPQAVCFLRSSAKPLQLIALLEAGGAQRFQLTGQEIAIMCASHSGSDEHFQVLQTLQAKIGISQADLLCGIHPPTDRQTAERLLIASEKPTPNRHNCSGKHTGMLALARILAASLNNYLDIDHPVQQLILRTFADICSMQPDQIELGIDGCSAPVFAVPLANAALAFARLSDPGQLGSKRADACRLIFESMSAHPYMVAGNGRFDTEFMSVLGGKIICKSGAEGYVAIGVQSGLVGTDSPAMGLALKISDGDADNRAGPLVAVEILSQLGVLKQEEMDKLQRFVHRPVTNWRKLEVGEIRPTTLLKNFQG